MRVDLRSLNSKFNVSCETSQISAHSLIREDIETSTSKYLPTFAITLYTLATFKYIQWVHMSMETPIIISAE